MDILLPLVLLSQKQYQYLSREIKSSNLAHEVRQEVLAILQDAVEHTKQAQQMGWVSEEEVDELT